MSVNLSLQHSSDYLSLTPSPWQAAGGWQPMLLEPGWAIRITSSKYQVSVFLLQIAASDHWCVGTEARCHYFNPYWLKQLLEETIQLPTIFVFWAFWVVLFSWYLKAMVFMGECPPCMPRKWCRLRIDLRRPEAFLSGLSLAQRCSTAIKQTNKTPQQNPKADG